jgi:inactivated superfamily I helicase
MRGMNADDSLGVELALLGTASMPQRPTTHTCTDGDMLRLQVLRKHP